MIQNHRSDLETMEDLLYESIEAKWGNEQLPGFTCLIKEARKHFDLGLKVAYEVAMSMIQNHRSDLETMDYVFSSNISFPNPPRYEG